MPKSLKQFLKDSGNQEILEEYRIEQVKLRREKARERANKVYKAGRAALKNRDK